MARPLRVATRGSELARWQAARVVSLLGVPTELVIVSTRGDRDTTSPIHRIGGTGAFVKEVQDAVLRGDADLAVHSAKDLPAEEPDGLRIGAVPERADVRDALVGSTWDALPTAATIGTGSVRRRAQLAGLRPDLTFGELRGNVPTRLAKAADFDAVVIAAAALDRLGLTPEPMERLSPRAVLPQVGQGALAVECRTDDDGAADALAAIDDAALHAAVRAERAFLAELGGGCTLPCGALASFPLEGALGTGSPLEGAPEEGGRLEGMLASADGHIVLRARARGADPEALGRAVALEILDDLGGRMLLEDVA